MICFELLYVNNLWKISFDLSKLIGDNSVPYAWFYLHLHAIFHLLYLVSEKNAEYLSSQRLHFPEFEKLRLDDLEISNKTSTTQLNIIVYIVTQLKLNKVGLSINKMSFEFDVKLVSSMSSTKLVESCTINSDLIHLNGEAFSVWQKFFLYTYSSYS